MRDSALIGLQLQRFGVFPEILENIVVDPVSYTHLDVYKRQGQARLVREDLKPASETGRQGQFLSQAAGLATARGRG